MCIRDSLARDYWEENRRQISDIVADSYLEGYDELNIGASFKDVYKRQEHPMWAFMSATG